MYTSVLIANLALLWVPVAPFSDKIFYIGQAMLIAGMIGCWHYEEQAMLAEYGSLAQDYYMRTPQLFFLYPIYARRKSQKQPIEQS